MIGVKEIRIINTLAMSCPTATISTNLELLWRNLYLCSVNVK